MFRIRKHVFGKPSRFPRITFGIVGYTHARYRFWGYYTKVQGTIAHIAFMCHI